MAILRAQLPTRLSRELFDIRALLESLDEPFRLAAPARPGLAGISGIAILDSRRLLALARSLGLRTNQLADVEAGFLGKLQNFPSDLLLLLLAARLYGRLNPLLKVQELLVRHVFDFARSSHCLPPELIRDARGVTGEIRG